MFNALNIISWRLFITISVDSFHIHKYLLFLLELTQLKFHGHFSRNLFGFSKSTIGCSLFLHASAIFHYIFYEKIMFYVLEKLFTDMLMFHAILLYKYHKQYIDFRHCFVYPSPFVSLKLANSSDVQLGMGTCFLNYLASVSYSSSCSESWPGIHRNVLIRLCYD